MSKFYAGLPGKKLVGWLELLWVLPVSILILLIAYHFIVFTILEAVGAVVAVWIIWIVLYLYIRSDGFEDFDVPTLWRCPGCGKVFEQVGEEVTCKYCGHIIVCKSAPGENR